MPALSKNIQHLHPEVLVTIFSLLSYCDILRCQRVCRHFRDVFNASALLRYLVELEICGYEDLPAKTLLGYVERSQCLQDYHATWKTPNPRFSKSTSLDYSPFNDTEERQFKFRFKLHDDVLVASTERHGDNSPPHYTKSFDCMRVFQFSAVGRDERNFTHVFDMAYDAFQFDPIQDLLIVGYLEHGELFTSEGCTILKPLSLRSGAVHPEASTPEICLPILSTTFIKMEICGDFIATKLVGALSKVLMINWKDGSFCVLEPPPSPETHGVVDFLFLSEIFLVTVMTRRHGQGHVLVIYSAAEGSWSGRIQSAIFHLPEHATSGAIVDIDETVLQTSLDRSLRGDEGSPPAFRPSSLSADILCLRRTTVIRDLDNAEDDPEDWDLETIRHTAVMFVPAMLGLMNSAIQNTEDNTPPEFHWFAWGPSCSRWFRELSILDPLGANIPLYGYHIICRHGVLDFNPVDIARDMGRTQERTDSASQADRSTSGSLSQHEFVTEATTVPGEEIFAYDVTTTLPFRVVPFKTVPDIPGISCISSPNASPAIVQWQMGVGDSGKPSQMHFLTF
ncbi:hypothetical protein GLOTRDRAFT_137175 [Gloeophyllum trabeum ATCC 11539]|uniref:F-box domain-containing protein n=1 Tax=Gloeophyllum trabeum (strain ATCC 11539 / FP-39264 / Madison 617) TaxID=670483 RepID=S7QGC2_GLOTA|nr:uncharacterized protein GLOTRDRAFT_137175 [Gloeophyllum trabeum ATCC 11539]EPQ58462.1 hypothetical protein GLOTRDRAFT_137175 [Gloeophyllum trabeum ATCC 11539]